MAGSTIGILMAVPWADLIKEAPALWRQASAAAASIEKLLSEVRKTNPGKESTSDKIARLSAEVEALASNQQQLADILTDASARQQTIVAKVEQLRKLALLALGAGGANLVLFAFLLVLR